MTIKETCINFLATTLNLEPEQLEALVEIPPQPDLGDLSLPCFQFAKTEHKAPQLIARDYAQRVQENLSEVAAIAEVRVVGPYLNLFYDRAYFAQAVFAAAGDQDSLLYHRKADQKKTILVEYSSPNIAKPFHVGHGFSTCLGDALAQIYEYLGYRVVRLNHLGDYGTQFGRLIAGWLRWGDETALQQDAIRELSRVYVKFHQEAELDDALYDEAREHFRCLEQGEPLESELWERFRELSLEEFKRIYDRLWITFDSYRGESFYADKMDEVITALKDKSLLEESEGAQVVRLDEYDMNPCIVIKSDGSSIYATRDLAAIFYRAKTWDYFRNIYVVGLAQQYYFQQIFAVIDKLQHPKAGLNQFVGFGLLHAGKESFSTRSGKVILLEDLLDETYDKVLEIMNEGAFAPDEAERQAVAETIAVDSVKFLYLRNSRENDINFSWQDMLDFNGDTAPYLLYAYARAQSILRKAELPAADILEAEVELLTTADEFQLLKDLAGLETAVLQAAAANEPSLLSRQILKAVRTFNHYYQSSPILKEENHELRLARLALCRLFSCQLKIALSLLGLRVVERM